MGFGRYIQVGTNNKDFVDCWELVKLAVRGQGFNREMSTVVKVAEVYSVVTENTSCKGRPL